MHNKRFNRDHARHFYYALVFHSHLVDFKKEYLMRLVLFTVIFLSACSSNINSDKESVVIPQETRIAMAKCSGQFSDSQQLFLEGTYLEYKGRIDAGKVDSLKGLVIKQEGMESADKVKLMDMYYKCIESHEQKKK